MFRLIPFWAYGVALLAAVGWFWGHGYQTGRDGLQAKIDEATADLDEKLTKARVALLERDTLIPALQAEIANRRAENERLALADPGACAVTDSQLQRLSGRWGPVPKR